MSSARGGGGGGGGGGCKMRLRPILARRESGDLSHRHRRALALPDPEARSTTKSSSAMTSGMPKDTCSRASRLPERQNAPAHQPSHGLDLERSRPGAAGMAGGSRASRPRSRLVAPSSSPGTSTRNQRTPRYSRNVVRQTGVANLYDGWKNIAQMRTWTPDYRDSCGSGSDPAAQLIDYFFRTLPASQPATDRLAFSGGRIVLPGRPPHPSDHCPVVAEISF